MLIIRFLILTVIVFSGTDKIEQMRISQYPDATALSGNEYLPCDQSGQTRKLTPELLRIYARDESFDENVKTYAQWLSAQGAGTLPGGQYIIISDKADSGIALTAITATAFSLSGHASYFNADFQNAGDYSGIAGYAGWLGQWHSGLAAVAINKVAIYNCLHYKNLTGAVGTAPSGDAVNWVVLAKSATNGYIEEIDAIEYDFANDYITKRADKRGNSLSDDDTTASGTIALFQWGNDAVLGNVVTDGGILSCLNNRGNIQYNNLTSSGSLTASTNSGTIVQNSINSGVFTVTSNTGTIENNIVNGGTFTAASNSGTITHNHINAESTLTATSNSGTIESNILSEGTITATTNAGTILQNTLNADATITANLNGGVSVRECLFSYITATLPVATNYTGKTCISGFSNFNCTISITGLTTLNITTDNNFCGVINVTSGNATEAITDITNRPTLHPFTIYPASGLTLTLTGDAVPTAANKIALGAASRILVGTNGDWIEMEQDRLGTGYSQELNVLIYN